jgi:general secretion pathway protein J
MTGASRTRGFTLIEVLVALAIFGVMSALAYMTLGQTLNNSDMLNERMDRLQAIQSPALPRTSHCS